MYDYCRRSRYCISSRRTHLISLAAPAAAKVKSSFYDGAKQTCWLVLFGWSLGKSTTTSRARSLVDELYEMFALQKQIRSQK